MVDEKPQRAPLNPSARSSARLGLGEVDVIAPGLIHSRFAGRVLLDHVEPLMRAGNEAIAAGDRVLIVIDADDVHAYEAEVRKVFQAWIRQHRDDLEGVWVLFRSPLVKMGLNLANAFTHGALRGFSDPDRFEEALAEATRRARAGGLHRESHSAVH